LHNGTMHSLSHYSILVFASVLLGCAEQVLPQFGDSTPVTVPSGKPAYGPRLSQDSSDDAVLSWMEAKDDSFELRFSTYDDGSWHPSQTAITDERMFVNWADLPSVNSVGSSSYLAHWLSYTADETYSYQVLTARSDDNGASWTAPQSPHTDATPTEHGFVSMHPSDNGTGMIWLDGRETPDKGMTLRGATLTSDGSLQDEALLDDLVCDCCQTDVAVTESGPIAIYRNRTEEEVRDIYVSRLIEGKWQTGIPISDDGWVISGCPVNGPSIRADGNFVAAAWFTAANGSPTVKVALSTNAGRSFSEPVEIASKNTLGHVGIAMIDRQTLVVSWMESDKNEPYTINIRGLTFDGQAGPVHTVGRTSIARAVPQLARVGDQLILAWTDNINELNKVASVKVPILGFYD
jgi:hypothetical protein